MSLFGTPTPDEEPVNPSMHSSFARSRHGLFDDDGGRTDTDMLFSADDDADDHGSARPASPWELPTPRKRRTRAELLRSLLPATDVPEAYIDAFDAALRQEHADATAVSASGVARVLAAAQLDADSQAAVMNIIVPPTNGDGPDATAHDTRSLALGRNEFNVLLALIGLVQEGEHLSLDGVDERRRNLPCPRLPGYVATTPVKQQQQQQQQTPAESPVLAKSPSKQTPFASSYSQPPPVFPQLKPASEISRPPPMDFTADDPWGAPDLHKDHQHENGHRDSVSASAAHGTSSRKNSAAIPGAATVTATATTTAAGTSAASAAGGASSSGLFGTSPSEASMPIRTTSNFTTTPDATVAGDSMHGSITSVAADTLGHNPAGAWGSYNGGGVGATVGVGGGFGDLSPPAPGVVGLGGDGNGAVGSTSNGTSTTRHQPSRSIGGGGIGAAGSAGGRTGSAIEETILVALLPEKEGMFMFQHHNYEVTSSRRGSKVIRRYSDFVWLLECLMKRYPFRVLPLLPPKRVAVSGNHLTNDGAFIEKRRRGLARFLNALVRHPVLSSEQLVVMFLTVPTELSVWRKQATISVQDEFTGRTLPPGLEASLSPGLKDLFDRTRSGVRRSAELYITLCNIMDRLVKRSEGVANDHARMAVSLQSLTEASADVYATDTNLVPLLNDGLVAMGKHLRTGQTLMEDEAKAWDAGVLDDLKRQRDALVGLRDLFDRRDRLDRDNIPTLERRIQKNEAKLAALRAKPEGLVKPGETERVVEAIIRDKESIVTQHNRSIFVKECLRDELVYFQATQYHVSRWNQDWAQERVKYAEMLADNWRRLLDELDGMPLGE